MFKSFKNTKIVLTYFGVKTDDITSSLIGLATQEKNNLTKNKIPVLIAESFQNIVRHGDQNKEVEGQEKEYFQIKIHDEYVVISSVNLVQNDKIQELQSKIDRINQSSKAELKELRKKILQDGHLSEKGGAGLGLIELAYKTGHKLKSKFIPANSNFSKFFLALTIGDLKEDELSINELENEYNELAERDVLLFYKGDFSWETSSFIIAILHENFASESEISNQKLKEITVLIEVIQNAAKHAKKKNGIKEGVLSIFSKNNKRSLYCGNYISRQDSDSLRKILNQIEGLTTDQISELYQKELLMTDLDQNSNAGLGLYEIAKQSNNGIEFSIIDSEDKSLYLTLKVALN